MTETKSKKALAPDGWDEDKAISDGHFFVDMFGVKHGLRTTSPDPAVAANPITQDEKDLQAALDGANETREKALAELQEGMRSDGSLAQDYQSGGMFYQWRKKRATPASLAELRAAFQRAEEDAQRARVNLSQAQARRADRIRQWNADQIVDSPLAKAIQE